MKIEDSEPRRSSLIDWLSVVAVAFMMFWKMIFGE